MAAGGGRLSCVVPALDGHDAGYFTGGLLTVTSGSYAGQSRTIRQHMSGGHLDLWEAFPAALASGTGVSVVAGCDKRFETCKGTFANALNFRGFPDIPTPDFILTYARGGEGGHDGGRLDP